MKFPQEFIEQVREAANLVDIIGQHTELKGRGSQHMGLCPFPDHMESTPSFSVSEDRQLYHCFGCKKSGNIYTFLQDFQGLSFPQAVEQLAKRYGMELPRHMEEQAQEWQEKKTERDACLELNKVAAVFFHKQLMNLPRSHRVWVYLLGRGLTEEMVACFRLGYAPEEWSELALYLKNRKLSLARAEDLGLIRKKKTGFGHFDFFRDRLMFPVFSQTRDILGFGGRSITPENQPKYLNSPETTVFHKGKTVYGLQESARHIRSQRQVVVVEGYMDLLALWRADIHAVVATLGTALTSDHAQLFKKFGDEVVLLFDGDSAGQEAVERSMGVLLEADLMPRVVVLPESLDPDDYLKKYGKESLQDLVHRAMDMFEAVLLFWMRDFRSTPAEKLLIIKKARNIWVHVKRESLKSLYISTLSRQLGESSEWVQNALKEEVPRPQKGPQKPEISTRSAKKLPDLAPQGVPFEDAQVLSLKGAPREEILVLSLALKTKKLMSIVVENEIVSQFSHAGAQEALLRVIEKSRQKPDEFDKLGALLASQIDNPAAIMSYAQYSQGELSESEGLQLMKDCLSRIQSRFLRNKARYLAHQVKDRPEREKLEQIMNIHKDRLSLKSN